MSNRKSRYERLYGPKKSNKSAAPENPPAKRAADPPAYTPRYFEEIFPALAQIQQEHRREIEADT